MHHVADGFACLKSAAPNLAITVLLFLAALIVLRAAQDPRSFAIGILLAALFAWRLIVSMIDIHACF